MKNIKYKISNLKHSDNGQALVSTILLLAAILAIALFITNIFVVEIRLAGDVTESVKAIMAADSGIEWMLFRERKMLPDDPLPSFRGRACNGVNCLLDNGASFTVTKTTNIIGDSTITTLASIGNFRNTKRGLKINYEN